MATIANWFAESQQQKTADWIVEDTYHRILERSDLLNAVMPVRTYDDFDILQYLIEQKRLLGSVMAFGQEIPLRNEGRFTKLNAQLFKVGTGRRYDERTQIALRKAAEEAALKRITVQNIYQGDAQDPNVVAIRGTNNSLAEVLFGSVMSVTMELMDLIRMLSFQALQFGFVNYEDTFTASKLTLDFRDPKADYGLGGVNAHFPPSLAGTAQDWANVSTAEGLRIIEEDCEVYLDTNGKMPDYIVMSRKTVRQLLHQDYTRTQYSAIVNAPAGITVSATGQIGFTQLEALMQSRDLPKIVTIDDQYTGVDQNGNEIGKRRFVNQGRYFFCENNMGERAIGPTVENDFAPGLFVRVKEQKQDPPVDVILGTASALPLIPNPKKLYAREVSVS